MAKGISLSLNVETMSAIKNLEDFSGNLAVVNANLKAADTVLKGTGATSLDYANKVALLNDKKQTLSKSIGENNEKLEEMKKAGQGASEEANNLRIEIAKQETELAKTNNEIDKTNKNMNNLGIETKKTGEEFDGTKAKASVFGDVLKANLASEAIIGGIKAIGGAIKEVGSALIDIGKQSVGSYANFEQLIGGVETLFKDSANEVQSYANNAYKTAGLSANQYMETVTSFSASLLQSLDGDTAKSAKVADMAITDMADNANKMGTSMGNIQTAYQGFAKQNYTMLDNLKLGYGGTKGEMERLLSDATKLSGVKYDISNLNDVYEAIHVVQTELGITGTTAKEASATISGSVSAMKSSWTNLITGLADGNADLEGMISNVVDSAMTVADNILPVIETVADGILEVFPKLLDNIILNLPKFIKTGSNILTSIITGLQSNMSSIMTAVMQILNMLISTIVENLPLIIEMGIQTLLSLIQGITESLPSLIPVIIDTIILIVGTVLDNIGLIIDAGISILFGLIDGIVTALPKLIDKIPEIIDKLIIAITDNLPKLIEAGIQLTLQLAVGLIKAIPQLVSKIPQIINSIVTGLLKGLGSMAEVGLNLVKGLWNGISDAANWILEKIKEFGGKILDGIKSFFGINSPSKVFQDEIGLNLGLGLAKGISNSVGAVEDAMNDLGAATLNTIEPVLNISPFENQDLFGSIESNPNAFQINFYPQNLSESELEIAFNYVNEKFGVLV